jgi:hypothetical protein
VRRILRVAIALAIGGTALTGGARAEPPADPCAAERRELDGVLARCRDGAEDACANRHRVQENYRRCAKRRRRPPPEKD